MLLNKENYTKYKDLIDLKYIKENYRELSYLYNILLKLHETNPDKDISLDEVKTFFHVKYPDVQQGIYDILFKTLQELKLDPGVGQGILEAFKRKQRALEASETAFLVANGSKPWEDLLQVMESLKDDKVDHSLPLTEVTNDLEELIEQSYSEQGYRWRLDCLNKSLGSLRRGDFGFIFARPETGKTTFLASECSAFLNSINEPIVWLNNEEQGSKVMLRVYQAFFGVTIEQLLSNPGKYKQEFAERTGGLFKLYDSATISRKDVESIITRTSPGLVVYDQIDKIKGFSNDREDLRLGSIYQWARELAKGSHAAIGVCQANGGAEGVRYLTMDHVAGAQTSKQAEADWILGIGCSHDETEANIRYLNISKNKLIADADSIPELRHGRFEVLFKPNIARYEDIIKYD